MSAPTLRRVRRWGCAGVVGREGLRVNTRHLQAGGEGLDGADVAYLCAFGNSADEEVYDGAELAVLRPAAGLRRSGPCGPLYSLVARAGRPRVAGASGTSEAVGGPLIVIPEEG